MPDSIEVSVDTHTHKFRCNRGIRGRNGTGGGQGRGCKEDFDGVLFWMVRGWDQQSNEPPPGGCILENSVDVLLDGEPEELCLIGEKVDAVLWLLLGLELDSDVSVLSVLLLFVILVAMLCVLAVLFVCSPSPSLESSDESPVNGQDLI